MKLFLHNALAIFAGLVVAFVLIAVIETVSHLVYPLPSGFDPSQQEQLRLLISTMPAGAFGLMILGWTVGAFGGSMVASRLGRGQNRWYVGVVGALVLLATVTNLLLIPHPTWVAIVGIMGVVFGSVTAGRIAGENGRRTRPVGPG